MPNDYTDEWDSISGNSMLDFIRGITYSYDEIHSEQDGEADNETD